MSASSLLMLFSNFGFYLLPRWETEKTLSSLDNCVGWTASQCFRMLICFNFKRVEATSNWVVGEEGLFKLAWQIIMPSMLLLLAMVPLPVPGSGAYKIQATVHLILAIFTFMTYTVCELYQLIRGEKIFKRSTGIIQKLRFFCMVCAAIGMFVYLGTQGVHKSKDSLGSFFSASFETVGFMFLLVDMMLICFIPIKAEQSVFALGGTQFRKHMCRQKSYYNRKSVFTKIDSSVKENDEIESDDESITDNSLFISERERKSFLLDREDEACRQRVTKSSSQTESV